MINHMITRLKCARKPDEIILCTSPNPQDRRLVDIAEQESIKWFCGHPDYVLLRLKDAAERFGVDTIMNCTADNPFVDPEYIDRLVDFHQQNGFDYSYCEGLPLGVQAWAVSYSAMLRACKLKAATDTEVWGKYFTDTDLFTWGTLKVDPEVHWPELRLTVDTPEDFEFVNRIFDELHMPNEVFPLSSIINLCRAKPDLVAINSSIRQKTAKPIRLKPLTEQLGGDLVETITTQKEGIIP